MSTRREARSWALQCLFELNLNPRDTKEVLRDFWQRKKPSREAKEFAEALIQGTLDNREEIDRTIQQYSEHWDIRRMKCVDRNVLRMAVYEMRFRDDIPPVVTINEAVDLCKIFSDSESGKFVNGILDHVRKDANRDARTAKGRCREPEERIRKTEG